MMTWNLSTYLLPYFVSAACVLAFAAFLYPRRHVPGCRPLAILMLSAGLWAAANGLELAAPTLPTKLFWARLQYVSKVTIPVAWLLTALHHAGLRSWITPRRLLALSLVPAITLVLTWTSGAHGWMMTDFVLDESGPVPLISKRYGPWFWAHIGYSYLIIAVATLTILVSVVRFPQLYRGQTAAWLIAAAVPLLGNASYLARVGIVHGLDLSSIAFGISSLVLCWGFWRFHLLDLIPAARETVVEAMHEGVFVVDAQGRIIDLNPAAERILGLTSAEALGKSASGIVPALARLEPIKTGEHRPVLETTLEREAGTRTYEIRVSPIKGGRREQSTSVVMLLDVTENRRLHADLEARTVIDELTGLYNRRGFFQQAEQEVRLAKRGRRSALLVFADIDGLKEVNDTQGHSAGDDVLVAAANVLRVAFRDTDVIARLGGDEFAILALDAGSADEQALGIRLSQALESVNLSARNPVAFSVGTAELAPDSNATLEELLGTADAAMYGQKRTRPRRRRPVQGA